MQSHLAEAVEARADAFRHCHGLHQQPRPAVRPRQHLCYSDGCALRRASLWNLRDPDCMELVTDSNNMSARRSLSNWRTAPSFDLGTRP